MAGLYWQLPSRHRRLAMQQQICRAACDARRTVTKINPKGHKHIQLLFKQIFNLCPEAGNQLQFKTTLEKLPVYYRTHGLGWDCSGWLVCTLSVLLLRADLCHNIIFHTLIPLTAHPSFFIIASNKY